LDRKEKGGVTAQEVLSQLEGMFKEQKGKRNGKSEKGKG
jgi:hypothetical protein